MAAWLAIRYVLQCAHSFPKFVDSCLSLGLGFGERDIGLRS